MLAIVTRRFKAQEPSAIMFTPAEAIAMQCETPEILSKADMAGQTERRGTVSKASLVQVAICADDHFAHLQGQRPAPTSPWELLYVDSWPVVRYWKRQDRW